MKNPSKNQLKRLICKILGIPFDGKLRINDLATTLKEKYPGMTFTVCQGKNGVYLRRYTPRDPTPKQAAAMINFVKASSDLYGTTGTALCEMKDGTRRILTRLAAELSLRAKNGKVKSILQTAGHQSELTELLRIRQEESVRFVMPMVEALV